MNRGYNLNRGRGLPKPMPRRALCPDCGKRGLGEWKPNPYGVVPMLQRTCRYCANIETKTWNAN